MFTKKKSNYRVGVILNKVKDLAMSLDKSQREILHVAQDDIDDIISLAKLKISKQTLSPSAGSFTSVQDDTNAGKILHYLHRLFHASPP